MVADLRPAPAQPARSAGAAHRMNTRSSSLTELAAPPPHTHTLSPPFTTPTPQINSPSHYLLPKATHPRPPTHPTATPPPSPPHLAQLHALVVQRGVLAAELALEGRRRVQAQRACRVVCQWVGCVGAGRRAQRRVRTGIDGGRRRGASRPVEGRRYGGNWCAPRGAGAAHAGCAARQSPERPPPAGAAQGARPPKAPHAHAPEALIQL